jgi:hypothetical protein
MYRLYRDILQPLPLPTASGMQTLLDQLARSDPKAKEANLSNSSISRRYGHRKERICGTVVSAKISPPNALQKDGSGGVLE